MEEQETNNKPMWQIHIGTCWASIWDNERTINGKTVAIRELSFSKRFRGEDGEYKNSTRYSINDIPKAILALQKIVRAANDATQRRNRIRLLLEPFCYRR